MSSNSSILLLLSVILCYGVMCSATSCSSVSAFTNYLDTALAEYEREAAPKTPVNVTLTLDIRHAMLEELTATMRVIADLEMYWKDGRLSWNATEWNCSTAQSSAERLWLPDIRLLTGDSTSSEDPLPARVSADGQVLWIQHIDARVPVGIDLAHWPSDLQSGHFTFASTTSSTDEMILTYAIKTAYVAEAGAWIIDNIETFADSMEVADSNMSMVSWKVRLRRRAPAHSLATGAVLGSSVLMLVGTALMPPHARAPLCAGAALTAALWLSAALQRLPGAASAPTALVALGGVCALAAVGAVCAAAVGRVAAVRFKPPPPPALRASLTAAAPYCNFTPHQCVTGEAHSGAWVAVSCMLDRVLLAAQGAALLGLLLYYMFA